MNQKNGAFGIALILCAVIFSLVGCQQPVENGDGSDRLLIEVWDSSTPPKFLGYDTGLGVDNFRPIILTSKGYCVELRFLSFSDENVDYYKMYYGQVPDRGQYIENDQWNEIMKENGWGNAIFFTTASNPSVNDIPYALFEGDNIINNVIYNSYNGGTYYTRDSNKPYPNTIIQANYKFYDNTGTIHTWNDDVNLAEEEFRHGTKSSIGEPFNFTPLKKIGGYVELGLPDPAAVTGDLVYKVKYP